MFEINSRSFGECTQMEIFDREKGVSFSFFPDYGATLNQLVLQGPDKVSHKLLCENVNYDHLITEGKQVFKGSKLFPFPNRIDSGNYKFGEEKFQLPINFPGEGHAIHGLVLEEKFNVSNVDLTKEHGIVELDYKYNQAQGYPFKFSLQIIFKLSESGFSCKTVVKNEDTRKIPVGDGWHPYFKTGSMADDLYICIPSQEEIEVNERKIPTGKTKRGNDFCELKKISDLNFDTCFRLFEDHDRSIVKLVDKDKNIRMNLWMDCGIDKYQYVQVYIPPARDCIAIEPMTCIPDAFNNGIGLIVIDPGETNSFLWGIHLT